MGSSKTNRALTIADMPFADLVAAGRFGSKLCADQSFAQNLFLDIILAQSWHGSSVPQVKVQDMTEIRISLAILVFRSMQKPPYVARDAEVDKTVSGKAVSF